MGDESLQRKQSQATAILLSNFKFSACTRILLYCTGIVHFFGSGNACLCYEVVSALPSADKIHSDKLTQVLLGQGMKAQIPASASKFRPINSHQVFLSQHWHFGNLFQGGKLRQEERPGCELVSKASL